MKSPKLRVKKKVKLSEIRKFKYDIGEVVQYCLSDIKPYIVNDILTLLKKRGIIYVKKNSKKNKKAKKR